MQNQHKPLLAVAAAATVVVVIAVASRSGSGPSPDQGGPLLPDLETRAGDAAKLVITRGPDELVIEKSAAGENDPAVWTVPSAGGYPADLEPMRDFIRGLAEAETVERKTDDPAKHAAVGLVAPSADGSGRATRAQLLAADGSAIADLLFGDADPAGVPGRSFVRLADQDQTWLADAPAAPRPDFRDWVDTELTRIAIGRVRSVTVNRADAEPVTITRDSMTGPWTLETPEDETLANGAGRRVGGALAFLNWVTALPSSDMGPAQHVTTYDLFDGSRITVTRNADQPLLTLSAEYDESIRLENESTAGRLADAETARQRVEEFNARHEGWFYAVELGSANAITPEYTALIESPDPAPDPAPEEGQDPGVTGPVVPDDATPEDPAEPVVPNDLQDQDPEK